jgi:hypothetical protein
MRAALCALLVCSSYLYVSSAQAEPIFIAGGSASAGPFIGGPFTLLGENFVLNGFIDAGLMGEQLGRAGETMPINLLGTPPRGGPGIFDSVSYAHIFYGGFLSFTASLVIPDDPSSEITLTTPFLFTGSLLGCTRDPSPAGCGAGNVIFDMELVGQGTATALITSNLFMGSRLYEIRNVTYEFEPIPEPGTLLTLGTGLALAAVHRTRRRKGKTLE